MTAELFTIEPEEPSKESDIGTNVLMLALKALSQRAIVAAGALFTLLTVASCFWLFMTIHDPNTMQLIEMALYAVFVLSANLIVRR